MDGGIADNLAMRSIINAILALSGDPKYLQGTGVDRVRRILLISADGQSMKDTSKARLSNLSGLDQIFDAVSGTQIDSYNFETMILANEELEKLRSRYHSAAVRQGPRDLRGRPHLFRPFVAQ